MSTINERREAARDVAYVKYTLPEFKCWATDKCAELIQQLNRINTKKYDKEELIRTALMVEDAISMLWKLHKGYEAEIEDAKNDIYSEFEKMQKEVSCSVIADKKLDLDHYKK